MDKEEAEALANQLLSHYGKQNWDEHFKAKIPIDNPNNHIFVKDARQFTAMVLRRGYGPVDEEKDEHGLLWWLNSNYTGRTYVRESFFLYETVAAVVERFDQWFGAGQHHMQHDCGFPLLRESKNTGDHETLAYRSARSGPTSKSLLACPQCEQYVQDDSVQEIRDEE